MKPLGHWGMVFEVHETDRPGCAVHDQDPPRCSCTNGCDRCLDTGFLPCGTPALGYIGSRPVCQSDWRSELEGIMLFRELFGLKEGEGLSLTPWARGPS
jgi:hypothetical protein